MARRSRKQENAEPQESSAPKHLSKYAAKKIAQAAAEARGEVYVSPKQAELTSNTVAALYGDGDELTDLHSGRVGRAASEAGAGVERGSDFDEATGERKRLKLKKGPTMVTMPGTNVKVPASRLNEDGTLKKRKTYIKVKRKDGSKIRIARRKPTYEKELFIAPEELAKLPERVAQKRLKRVEHENQIKEARKAALAKLRAEGKRYDPSPDAVAQNRFEPVTVVTLGIKTQDRVPDYDDPLEVESAKQPHNMRSSLLFAPIKRVNKPIVGTDFLAKWLDGWEKRNDAAGIFHDLFTEVKRVRCEENGIAYIGLPAFLLFIEGVSKRDIIDSYALDFKRFIKRREVTDFISAMKGPALSWFAARHNFDSAYALVYFDTYPVHFKLGRKRVYVEHELFIIGVTLDGRKDLMGVIPDFSSKRTSLIFWDTILSNLKNLGCQHICFALAAFKCRFLDKALRKHYPEATLQYNLLEVMQFDSYQLPSALRKEFMADSAQLCEAADYTTALTELNELRAKWEPRLPEGTTVLQGNLEYLKNYTMLGLEERKLLNTNKMVAHEAAFLMGKKAPSDFFSDHAEFLNFLFYRYVIWAKHEWLEHQDEALYNLKFSRLFAHLRTQEVSGAQLLDELLTERQQDFMYRHFGQFSSGPIFSLNANRKRISLTGQVDVTGTGALQGASWQESVEHSPEPQATPTKSEPQTELQVEPKVELSAQAVAQVTALSAAELTPEAGSSFGLNTSTKAVSLSDDHVMGTQAAQVFEPLEPLLTPVPPAVALTPRATVPGLTSTLTLQAGTQNALTPRTPKRNKLSAAIAAQHSIGFDKAGLSILELAPTKRTFNGEVLTTGESAWSQEEPDLAVYEHAETSYRGDDSASFARSYTTNSAQLLAQMGAELDDYSLLPAKGTLPQVSSNISSANAVMGMFKPTIEQALKEEHDQLKQAERQLIYRLLGHNFNFDEVNNVIFQVTPIFREALQNKQKEVEARAAEQEQVKRQREKEKARARYLKRQERKAQLAAAAAAFDPIKPEAITMGNDLAQVALSDELTPVSAEGASLAPVGASFDPSKVTVEPTYSSSKVALSSGAGLEVSPQVMSSLLSAATVSTDSTSYYQPEYSAAQDVLTVQAHNSTVSAGNVLQVVAAESRKQEHSAALMALSGSALFNEAEQLTLNGEGSTDEEALPIQKTADAHCPVPAPEIRSALAEQLAPLTGVSTPKLDAKVKLK